MTEENNSDKTEQNAEVGAEAVPDPNKTLPPQQTIESKTSTETSAAKPKPPREVLVRLVGDDELKPFEEQTLRIAKRTYRLTKFGFWIALGAAVFVGVQVREMSYQTQILSSEAITAVANSVSADNLTRQQLSIAQQQATAAQASATAIQRQMRVSERGQLSVITTIPFPQQLLRPVTAAFRMTNVGKTAIRGEYEVVMFIILHEGESLDFVYPKSSRYEGGTGIIYPQGIEDRPFNMFEKGSHEFHLITQTEIDEVRDRKAQEIVYGRVTYQDIFGYGHWNTFCEYTLFPKPDAPMAKKCAAYNATDYDK